MQSGTGMLTLRDRRRLLVQYQLGGGCDETREGYLLCDISDVDPAGLMESLHLICDDGIEVTVAVMGFSDKHLAVTGRVVEAAA